MIVSVFFKTPEIIAHVETVPDRRMVSWSVLAVEDMIRLGVLWSKSGAVTRTHSPLKEWAEYKGFPGQ